MDENNKPLLPPPPTQNKNLDSHVWQDWFRKVREYVVNPGTVSWGTINFAGSSLADIQSRDHNVLQGVQGGASGQFYHLKQDDYNSLWNYRLVSADTTATANDNVILVDTSADDVVVTIPSSLDGRQLTIKKITSDVNLVNVGNLDGGTFYLTNSTNYVRILVTSTMNYRIG